MILSLYVLNNSFDKSLLGLIRNFPRIHLEVIYITIGGISRHLHFYPMFCRLHRNILFEGKLSKSKQSWLHQVMFYNVDYTVI